MSINYKVCTSDEDYAQASLFLIKHRRDLHPSFLVIDMVELIYSYITEGNLIVVTEEEGQVVGMAGYYYGTPELDYSDKHEVVFVDQAIITRSRRSTRVFLRGFQYLANQITQDHPEVHEFRFAALSDNTYLQRLYSKFAAPSYEREGTQGTEQIYSANMKKIQTLLGNFGKL